MADLKIFANNIEAEALNQIHALMKQPVFQDSKVRIMPDAHLGVGCVIGFTANLIDKVIPNVVGVDLGCGMRTYELGKVDISLERLDEVIHKCIPSGRDIHRTRVVQFPKIRDLHCFKHLKERDRFERSIGTLGGGNHFIELDVDDEGNKYLVIHTGSRNLGKQVAEHYQKLAVSLLGKSKIPRDLCYLSGEPMDRYLHDMKICQEYARLNRETIGDIILSEMKLKPIAGFETIHNYIDLDTNIIRKGAISAKKGELLLIPINMRDGCILGRGKGNEDWNCSAPHGAGRVMSRTEAKKTLSMDEYKKAMDGIYTSSVSVYTIDEAPMAYKPLSEIAESIADTVEVLKIIKPVYNFKASE
ncbi:MAG TPA: RtcB family protein [Clostridiales bacterium]|jgi:tRNA-splicing ligase RtcB|nr:RtcB family protein [Clostridiales bacterium]